MQEYVLPIFLFVIGIILIVKCGDMFVDAASWFAEISGIPKLIVGATVVSIATTLPELLVSAMASSTSNYGIAIGNAVGSVTANIGLIMAISLICMPSIIKRSDYMLKSILMLGAAAIIVVSGFLGGVNTIASIALLAIFVFAMFENIKSAVISVKRQKAENKMEEKIKASTKTVIINILKFVLGAAGIVIGADLLKTNGCEIARMLNVSEAIIGVTVIAVGTSLPELVTTISAIAKKEASLSVGNIIGANIIDLTLILPICNFISGKTLPANDFVTKYINFPFCLLVGAIAVVPMLISSKFKRWQGITLLAVYLVYIAAACYFTISGVA